MIKELEYRKGVYPQELDYKIIPLGALIRYGLNKPNTDFTDRALYTHILTWIPNIDNLVALALMNYLKESRKRYATLSII